MKKTCFSQTGKSVSFLQICDWNILTFKENHTKVKDTVGIHMFSCDIMKISNS